MMPSGPPHRARATPCSSQSIFSGRAANLLPDPLSLIECAEGKEQLTMRKAKGALRGMADLLAIVGFVALWFVLQAWVLPRLGVPT